MNTFVTQRLYTLAIADDPYGFCAPNFVNDDVKYGVSAYKRAIEAFCKVTTCDSWSLVFSHAHDQITAVQKAFTNSNMICQMITWGLKPLKSFVLELRCYFLIFSYISIAIL